MAINFSRSAHFRIKASHLSFTSWANYQWHKSRDRWVCIESNEGFHKTFDIPYEITDEQMILLTIKYGEEQ